MISLDKPTQNESSGVYRFIPLKTVIWDDLSLWYVPAKKITYMTHNVTWHYGTLLSQVTDQDASQGRPAIGLFTELSHGHVTRGD